MRDQNLNLKIVFPFLSLGCPINGEKLIKVPIDSLLTASLYSLPHFWECFGKFRFQVILQIPLLVRDPQTHGLETISQSIQRTINVGLILIIRKSVGPIKIKCLGFETWDIFNFLENMFSPLRLSIIKN